LGDSGYRPTGPSQVYATFSFAPLPAGTTFVRVKHNVPGGGTTLIPINLSGLNRLPAPLTLNATRASGRVRVRFIRVVRGASLSEMDLEAQGFGDPGGEISTTTQGNTTTQTMRPPQIPDNVTLRTATGVDLLPEVGPGSVSHGVVKASI